MDFPAAHEALQQLTLYVSDDVEIDITRSGMVTFRAHGSQMLKITREGLYQAANLAAYADALFENRPAYAVPVR